MRSGSVRPRRKRKNRPRKVTKWQSGVLRTVKIWALLLIMGYASYVLISQQIVYGSLKAQKESLLAQIAVERANREVLMKRIDALSSDEYIEKIAREQLGLVKPGEVPYVIRDENSEGPESPANSEGPEMPKRSESLESLESPESRERPENP
ncbi:MAG TPA: septum formation initiator family protein [Clostridia bacterium]|nr:septum formation initiator family protein [Clostridia bacterium]